MYFLALNLCAQEDTLRVIRDSLQLIPKEPNEIQWVPFQLSADKRMDCSFPNRTSSDSSVQFSFKKPSLWIFQPAPNDQNEPQRLLAPNSEEPVKR